MRFRRFLWILLIVAPFIFKKRSTKVHNNYTPKHSKKVLPAERIWQRAEGVAHPNSACGPTTAAMLVQYVAESCDEEADQQAMLVNDLYKQIRTRPWGTSARKWRKGVERYFRQRWPANDWHVNVTKAENEFGLYCQSIDRGIPVVLRFILNKNPHAFASHHYILGIGYRMKNGRPKVAVLDADGGKLNKWVHWIDWQENERFIKILRVIKS